jgi:hypothetical protein
MAPAQARALRLGVTDSLLCALLDLLFVALFYVMDQNITIDSFHVYVVKFSLAYWLWMVGLVTTARAASDPPSSMTR